MTKESAKKHSEVIKWWIDNPDKGVWVQNNSPENWSLMYNPDFHIACTYVQNDEYCLLRQAQADGKVIQFNRNPYGEEWVDYDKKGWDDFESGAQWYRIKPEEPTFKEGDWVKCKGLIGKIISIQTQTCVQFDEGQSWHSNEFIEPWKPSKNEWCVFYTEDSTYKVYRIARYSKSMFDGNYYIVQTHENAKEGHRNIAPLEFIQTLKDK